jgi:dTDP-4-amino-4,6-dideoxygalactose transaminase
MPDISDAEINSVVETLRCGWLTTGPKVRWFEADFAQFVGCQHAVAVNSATAEGILCVSLTSARRVPLLR